MTRTPRHVARRLGDIGAAVVWAVTQHRRVRRALPQTGMRTRATPPRRLSFARDGRFVAATLRVTRATCLEESIVIQEWLLAHGRHHDLVVGVTTGDALLAHAWVEGVTDSCGHTELHRRPAA